MNCYISFWEITKDALSYAMKSLGMEDNDLKEKLLIVFIRVSSIAIWGYYRNIGGWMLLNGLSLIRVSI